MEYNYSIRKTMTMFANIESQMFARYLHRFRLVLGTCVVFALYSICEVIRGICEIIRGVHELIIMCGVCEAMRSVCEVMHGVC